ncbi:MAG: hypothetical protein P8182_10110 [Deltaproteobacteria bacterium]
MDLLRCMMCGGEYDCTAEVCPHCGHPNNLKVTIQEMAESIGALDFREGIARGTGIRKWEQEDPENARMYLTIIKRSYDEGWKQAERESLREGE